MTVAPAQRPRSRVRHLGVLGLLLGLVSSAACGDDDEVYDGPRSECSTGEPYAPGTELPASPNEPSAPACVPRCGETARGPDSFPLMSALPTGSCPYERERCTMAARYTCRCADGSTGIGAVNGYACRCEGGAWRCVVSSQGASPCSCPGPDAGSDDGG